MSHPSSLSTSLPDEIPTSAPRTTSLAAAAAVNAGLHREASNDEPSSRRSSIRATLQESPGLQTGSPIERQRNSVAMSLNLNDPALPSAGEMQTSSSGQAQASSKTIHSPPSRAAEDRSRSSSIVNLHGRQPSVGEVYQEMEQEQEAQVNRLLQTIRLQQSQIQALQAQTGSSHSDGTSAIADGSPLFAASNGEHVIPTADRARRESQISPAPVRSVPTGFQLSQNLPHEQEHAILSSGRVTPALPTPTSSISGAARDEVAFYQAENQNLNRENQLLKARIRELEQQQPSRSRSPASSRPIPAYGSNLFQEQDTNEEVANTAAK